MRGWLIRLLPFEKDIVNLGFASVDNVFLSVAIWSITLSTVCYLYSVFVLFFVVLLPVPLDFPFWLPLRYSLTFIQHTPNSFKFVDSYFHGLRGNCIFMDMLNSWFPCCIIGSVKLINRYTIAMYIWKKKTITNHCSKTQHRPEE